MWGSVAVRVYGNAIDIHVSILTYLCDHSRRAASIIERMGFGSVSKPMRVLL